MKLIVGLGNPGAKYENTRHNIGFILIDALAKENWRSKFQALYQKITIADEEVLLVKPQTFMNLSGDSVAAVAKFYKIKPQDILVIHDELDLPPGKIKLKKGGGHAGHNGLRSIVAHMGADFERMRVGIGHPGDRGLVSAYVLHDFSKADWLWIEDYQSLMPSSFKYYLKNKPSLFIETMNGNHSNITKTKKPNNQHERKPLSDKDAKSQAEAPESSSPFAKLIKLGFGTKK